MDSATQMQEVARDEQSLLERLEQAQSPPTQLAVDDIYSQSDDDQEEGEPHEIGSDSDSSDDGSVGYVPPSGRASVVNAEMMEAEEPVVTVFPPRTQILDEPSRGLTSTSFIHAPSSSAVEPGSQEWLRAAAAIEIPDLLKWTARHSSFSFAEINQESRSRVMIKSHAPQLDAPEPFIGLSSDKEFLSLYEQFAQNFRDSDADQVQSSIGKYISPKVDFKVNMTTYKQCDNDIRLEPMKFPLAVPNFIFPVKGHIAAPVRDVDLQHFEENYRKTLVILGNLEASMQAMLNQYPQHDSPDVFMMRSLYRVSQGLSDITQLASRGFHQTVVHRRDAAIRPMMAAKPNPVVFTDEQLLSLRHAPALGSKSVFEKPLLEQIKHERQSSSQDRLLSAAMTKLAYGKPSQSSGAKRSASSQGTPQAPKKAKASATVSKPPQSSVPSAHASGQSR